MVKNPNWQKGNQVDIYKRRGCREQQKLVFWKGFEPATSGFQVQRLIDLASLSPIFDTKMPAMCLNCVPYPFIGSLRIVLVSFL